MTRLILYAPAIAAGMIHAALDRVAAALIRKRPPDIPTAAQTAHRDQYRPPAGDRPYRWL